MSTIDLCPTCLRPASLRKAAEIDIHSRQAEADRLNAFVASMEAAVCGAVGVDPVAVRLAALEAENKALRAAGDAIARHVEGYDLGKVARRLVEAWKEVSR